MQKYIIILLALMSLCSGCNLSNKKNEFKPWQIQGYRETVYRVECKDELGEGYLVATLHSGDYKGILAQSGPSVSARAYWKCTMGIPFIFDEELIIKWEHSESMQIGSKSDYYEKTFDIRSYYKYRKQIHSFEIVFVAPDDVEIRFYDKGLGHGGRNLIVPE
ncbi:MAG: hypothetical protein JEZ07_11685 [Phycisphaerae bacterium]|nr:hypothetical protein [Phycisphaerae bacterium]